MKTPSPPEKINVIFEGVAREIRNNEDMLPPQKPVGGRLSEFVEGWKRTCIMNVPYVLSMVTKGYRLRFTSPPLLRDSPWEIRSPQGQDEIQGMREQISLMLQKNVITEVPPDSPGFYSNVLMICKASGGWRPVIDLKGLNAHIYAPHFHMFTITSVLSTVRKGDYAFNIDLQDAYFHVPIYPSSKKYLRFAFENKAYQFGVLPFGLNTAPQVFTHLGHTITGYLHHLGISVIPYLDDWLVHHPDHQVLLCHQSQLLNTLELMGFILTRKKSELDLVQDIQFLRVRLRLQLGRAFLPESKVREIITRAHVILPTCSVVSQSGTVHGLTQLSLRSYPSGSFIPEAITTTFSLLRSDELVFSTASVRPAAPCQPTSAVARPIFSNVRFPHPTFEGGIHDFHGCFYPGVGRPYGGFSSFGFLDPFGSPAPYQMFGA